MILIGLILAIDAPALGRGDYIAIGDVGPLSLYDAATLRLVATIPLQAEVPTGVVVDDTRSVAIRSARGLSVYSMDGTRLRTLNAEYGRGWLGR